MRDISREKHPPQRGGLLSDTIPNPKSGGEEAEIEAPFEVPSEVEEVQVEISKVIEFDPVLDVPKAQDRLVKKTEDAKCQRFYDQLKQLSMNILFLDTFQEMAGFAKYLKELLTKKRPVEHDTVSMTHRVSSIISITRVQKKEDPGAFTIPCYVGHHDFACTLCENGANINLMSLAIYKKSWLGMPRPTTMRL
ncbi:uncharacterized protein LOC132630697 [Lycium barbarum]|uniref:uncharacterized protein LOC132630697 n=1 Tax=Lycium barbarum TaxID=112863 RepID=UPI00293F3249|nr:uncharacterized protein LOC132630697 [Lycium barbarum]